MRDRLIKLLKENVFLKYIFSHSQHEKLADYFLANGVIVPPCKVGDMVYSVGKFTGDIVELRVEGIYIPDSDDIYLLTESGTYVSVKQQIGKSVFLTPEAAEQALKGGNAVCWNDI